MRSGTLASLLIKAAFILILAIPELTFAQNNREYRPVELQWSLSFPYFWGYKGGYHLNETFFLGAEYNGLRLLYLPPPAETTYGGAAAEIQYTGYLSLYTSIISSRYFFFVNSGFYAEYGLALRNWTYYSDIKISAGPLKDLVIGRVNFFWNNIAHTFSIGYNWIADSGFSGGYSLGALLSGKVRYETEQIDLLYLFRDLEDDASEMADFLNKRQLLPTFRIYLGYNF